MSPSVRRLLNHIRPPRPATDPAPLADMPPFAPDRPLYVVGDIHGSAHLVEPLLQRIDADVTRHGHDAAQLVFLGDYVDRGPGSAQVLARLHDLATTIPHAVVCLMGNHERMMLDFLDDPAGRGARWLVNGGPQTLASYGIGGLAPTAPVEDLTEAADALLAAMPDGMADWLRHLPLWHQSGNVVCVHAAMNPARPPDDQDERAMLWGHRDFTRLPREDGMWVVHGHTIVKDPAIVGGRVCVDTGAYHSGRLTAAAIADGTCRFL